MTVLQNYEVELVCDAQNLIGENPLWHTEERALYWVDTRRPSLQRLDADGDLKVWPMPKPIGSFVFRERGGLARHTGTQVCRIGSGAVNHAG